MGYRGITLREKCTPGKDGKPLPPTDFAGTPLEETWTIIVGEHDLEWFDTLPSQQLLVEYIITLAIINRLDDRVLEFASTGGEVDEDTRKMLTLRSSQVARLVSIATQLRITNQSRYTTGRAATQAEKARQTGGAEPGLSGDIPPIEDDGSQGADAG